MFLDGWWIGTVLLHTVLWRNCPSNAHFKGYSPWTETQTVYRGLWASHGFSYGLGAEPIGSSHQWLTASFTKRHSFSVHSNTNQFNTFSSEHLKITAKEKTNKKPELNHKLLTLVLPRFPPTTATLPTGRRLNYPAEAHRWVPWALLLAEDETTAATTAAFIGSWVFSAVSLSAILFFISHLLED